MVDAASTEVFTMNVSKQRWQGPQTALLIALLLSLCTSAHAEQGGSVASAFTTNPFADLEVPDVLDEELRDAVGQQHAEQGREHLRNHEYEQAARALEISFRLSGDPHVLYDLADALRRLSRYAAAAERLRLYIDRVGPELTPEQRVELEQEIQELRSQYAVVTISTDPQGASLLLGQRLVGTTPLENPLKLNHGHYELHIHLDGYRDIDEDLTVAGGRALDLSYTLERMGRRRHPALDIALWVNVALSVVGVTALTITAVGAAGRRDECYGGDCSSAALERYESLTNATWGLTGTTSATGIAALILGLVRLLGDSHHEEE
jgi:hypothetical protein